MLNKITKCKFTVGLSNHVISTRLTLYIISWTEVVVGFGCTSELFELGSNSVRV